MSSKTYINKINKYLLMMFLVLHPLFELLNEYFGSGLLEIFGLSVVILLKNLMFILMIALAIIVNFERKATWVFLVYAVLFGIFVVLQYINVRNCDITIFDGSVLRKGLLQVAWIASKYAIVIGVIYLVYLLKFGYKDFRIVFILATTLVVLATLGANLLGLDYIAYKYGSTDHPDGNILSWFTSEISADNWRVYTSRGLFSSGNSVSAFFCLALPITLFIAWQDKKIYLFGLVLLEILTMLTVGTRVSVYGIIILFVAVCFVIVLDLIINKKPISKKNIILSIAVLVIFGLFFSVSPFISRIKNGEGFNTNYKDNTDSSDTVSVISSNTSIESSSETSSNTSYKDNTDSSDTVSVISSNTSIESSSETSSNTSSQSGAEKPSGDHSVELSRDEKLDYIRKNFWKQEISYPLVFDVYDYEEHTDFWYDLLTKVEHSKKNNGRKIKSLILEDIINTKNGKLDKIVGIGEVSIYPEIDTVAIYYYYGVLGVVLFLLPQVIILLLSAFKILRDLIKGKFDTESGVLVITIAFLLFIGYFAGHTLSFCYVNVFIGLICGKLLINFANKIKRMENEDA